ncbi:MAG: hypothetical protein Q8P95_02955 [bacterium]|nr:hypothetical protein [bacterium]
MGLFANRISEFLGDNLAEWPGGDLETQVQICPVKEGEEALEVLRDALNTCTELLLIFSHCVDSDPESLRQLGMAIEALNLLLHEQRNVRVCIFKTANGTRLEIEDLLCDEVSILEFPRSGDETDAQFLLDLGEVFENCVPVGMYEGAEAMALIRQFYESVGRELSRCGSEIERIDRDLDRLDCDSNHNGQVSLVHQVLNQLASVQQRFTVLEQQFAIVQQLMSPHGTDLRIEVVEEEGRFVARVFAVGDRGGLN